MKTQGALAIALSIAGMSVVLHAMTGYWWWTQPITIDWRGVYFVVGGTLFVLVFGLGVALLIMGMRGKE